MPSGRTHATITVCAAGAGFVYLSWTGTSSIEDAGLYALGCFSGILLSPDLDVKYTVSNSVMDDIGALPGLVWSLLWWPYSKLLPHRHWLSHGLVVGTAGRLGYVWLAAALILRRWPALPAWSPPVVAGLLVSDNLHIGADALLDAWHNLEKFIRKLWRRK